jgi:hypothetical protein
MFALCTRPSVARPPCNLKKRRPEKWRSRVGGVEDFIIFSTDEDIDLYSSRSSRERLRYKTNTKSSCAIIRMSYRRFGSIESSCFWMSSASKFETCLFYDDRVQ